MLLRINFAKFKSWGGGLRDERGVATWNFGNRPSICLKIQEKDLLQQIVLPFED